MIIYTNHNIQIAQLNSHNKGEEIQQDKKQNGKYNNTKQTNSKEDDKENSTYRMREYGTLKRLRKVGR